MTRNQLLKLKKQRAKRLLRIRAELHGTATRPRITVFRSNKHVSVQVVNDDDGHTLFGHGETKTMTGTKTERAKLVANEVAKHLQSKKIASVIFDRGTYRYHGRVRVIADTLREAGITV